MLELGYMTEVVIRKAREDELKVVQELNHRLFLHDEEYDSFLDMNWSFGKAGTEYFKRRIAGKDGVCFVAELDGEIVGYLAGGLIKPYSYRTIKKQTELENTLVKEGYRGRGIGEKLFKKFVVWSRERGAQRIKVSASAENLRAIKFYRRTGFVPYASELEYGIK